MKNITCFAVNLNTKNYILFLFENILQISVKKKWEKKFTEVIQHIILENHINIDNQNSPTLFFNFLYYTTLIYENSAIGFRLGSKHFIYKNVMHEIMV